MGTMAKKINMLLIEIGITKQELARRLGTTPSNLSGKLKRDKFSGSGITGNRSGLWRYF